MSSFMSGFAAFAITASGWKKRMSNPAKCDKYIEKLRKINAEPFDLPTYPYHSLVDKRIVDNTEVLHFNIGRDKKIIYLHGGAYCEPPRILHFLMCDNISYNTDYEIIFPLYKRAPNSTFKVTYAFLENYYKSLLETTAPENIVFMGDSSGGGLSLGFAQYLKTVNLPQPSKIIMFSPWLDVSMSEPFSPELDKLDPNLVHGFLKKAGEFWAGDTDVRDYRVSPIYGDLKDLAPITVFMGTHEAILPDARRFRDRCREEGAYLDYREFENMNHAFIVYPIPEAKKAQSEVIDLLKK